MTVIRRLYIIYTSLASSSSPETAQSATSAAEAPAAAASGDNHTEAEKGVAKGMFSLFRGYPNLLLTMAFISSNEVGNIYIS